MLLLPLGGTKKLEAGESSLWKKGLEDPIYTGRGKARGGWEGIRHEDSPMGLGLSVPPEQVWGGTTFIPILLYFPGGQDWNNSLGLEERLPLFSCIYILSS